MRILLIFIAISITPVPCAAQESAENFYTVVLENESFIVGARNAPSGIFRFEGDTLWTHLGWTNVRSNGLSYVRSQPDTLFLAAGNGVFRSFDAGRTWRITTGWKITEAQDVAVDALEPRHVYAATAYGIRRTEDLGDHWSVPEHDVSPMFLQTITADAAEAGHAIAGGEGGLFETNDFGLTWHHVGPAGVDVRDVQQNSGAPNLWLAGTGGRGVLISRDGGKTWTEAGGAVRGTTIYAVAANPANSDHLAAAGFDTGLFLSIDGGRSWNRITQGLPVRHAHALEFDPGGSGRLWIGTVGAGVYRLDPGTDTPVYAGLDGASIWDLVHAHKID